MPEAAVTDRAPEAIPEPPIQGYEQSTGRPFIADILELSPIWGKSGLEDKLGSINQYVLSQLSERGYEGNKDSYRAVVNELMGTLGIEPNLAYHTKINKLSTYINVLTREAKLRVQRQALENYASERR